jgi:hypothetical protein
MNGGFVQSWVHLGHNMVFQHLAMLFYQQEWKSCTDNLNPTTSHSLYINAYKYDATTGRQSIVDKIKKRFKKRSEIKKIK